MSKPGPAARGYGITKADLEASRLVFVSLRDSVPKRKVAVPVPDTYSWEQFLEQVKTKLRLEAVGSVYFASSGERIASLDGLEDIDELYVEQIAAGSAEARDVPPKAARSEASTSELPIAPSPSTRIHRQTSAVENDINHAAVSIDNGEVPTTEEEDKYLKRSSLLKRMAQRILPETLPPGLPITFSSKTMTSSEEKGGKKRRRRKAFDTRLMLLIFAVLGSFITMTVLFLQMTSNPERP